MAGPDAAPAVGRRTLLPVPGGPGQPSGPTMRVCPQGLDDGGRRKAAGSRLDGTPHKGVPVMPPGSTAYGDRNRRK